MRTNWVVLIWLCWSVFAGAEEKLPVVPEGWTRELGKQGAEEARQILGSWENEEKTVRVDAVRYDDIPSGLDLLGLFHFEQNGAVEAARLPRKIEILQEPVNGLRVSFGVFGEEKNLTADIYLFPIEQGSVLLVVNREKDAAFSHKGWSFGASKDEDYYDKLIKAVGKIDAVIDKIPKTIKIEENIQPPVNLAEDGPRIEVVIRVGGNYFVEGKKVSEEELKEALQEAREKDEATVLQIRAEKEVEFKFAQRVIKLGASVGIDRLAYRVFPLKE